jgi:hypothetical protein
MVLAESAAAGASMAIDGHEDVQHVDVKQLQELLAENPLMDGSTPEVLADNDDSAHVAVTGNWRRQLTGGYGPSWLMSTSTAHASVCFRPAIKVAGRYSLYAYIPLTDSAATNMRYIVHSRSDEKDLLLPSPSRIEGQTSGEWVSLGTYTFDKGSSGSVTVSTDGADGYVAADAVLFVPAR